MTFTNFFFYLGFVGLPAYYAIEVAQYFYARQKHRKLIDDLEHQIALKGEGDLTDYAHGFSMWIIGLHAIWGGLSVDDYGWIAGAPAMFGVFAQILSRQNQALAPIIQRHEAMKIEQQKQANFQSHFEDVGADDGSFDYQDHDFNASGSRAGKTAPRGFEGRHPEDSNLWAFVDDPAASDQERKTALDKILARQAKRAGKAGGDVVQFRA